MRAIGAATAGLILGAVLALAGDRAFDDERPDGPRLIREGTLRHLPSGPVRVRAELVVLPAGFASRHVHGGPTFNFVESGTLEIEDGGERTLYTGGDFFFEPARHPHTIRVRADAALRVVRLLPPGAEATREVGS